MTPRQITHVNEALFKDIQQSQPEEIWYKSGRRQEHPGLDSSSRRTSTRRQSTR